MLSTRDKEHIATIIQLLLQSIDDAEMAQAEIPFILHIDGIEPWAWANIRNNGARDAAVPDELVENLTAAHI